MSRGACVEAKRDGGMGLEENQWCTARQPLPGGLSASSGNAWVTSSEADEKAASTGKKTQLGGMEFRNSASQLYQELPKCLYSNFEDPRDETTRYHVKHAISSQKDTPCKNAPLNLVRKKHQTNPN